MATLATSAPAAPAHTYGQILRSTAWIGGSSVANVAFGVVRTKVMALLLGPAGMGLFGVYGSIAQLAENIAGMGVSSSGVRQIASAAGSGEAERIARTATVLRWTSLALGATGALGLVLFSRQISFLTFGNEEHAAAIAVLSIAVLLRLVASGQMALIQGLRRISDLAMLTIWGALGGTLLSIPAVYVLGERGVVVSLVAVAAAAGVATWWYTRRAQIPPASLTFADFWPEAAPLLKLGFAFMASGLLTVGAAYVIRLAILRTSGVEAAGLYHAAWSVAGLYVTFILQAMGADFYPRLTAVADDPPECNRLVNEQAHVSLLLAGPGVLATITCAPLVLAIFYSASFGPAVVLLRWITLGMALRVITWPLGFVLLAKAEQRLFLAVDLAWTLVHVGLAWACMQSFGPDGAGMAFFGSYVFHGVVLYPLVNRLTGFRWSAATRRSSLLFLSLIAATFAGFALLPGVPAAVVGAVAVVVGCVYSLRELVGLLHRDQLPRGLRSVLLRLDTLAPRARNTSR
jgi:PST family polysaccharide transporter